MTNMALTKHKIRDLKTVFRFWEIDYGIVHYLLNVLFKLTDSLCN